MKVPITLSLTGFLLVATPALAQKRDATERHEMRARISDAITTRVAAACGLDAPTTAKFKAIVAKHAVVLEAQEQAMAAAKKQLRQLVAGRSNDATALNQASDAYLGAFEQHLAAREAREKDVRAAVTPAQFAMMLLESPRVEREVKKQLLSAAGKGDEE